ncbi:MAG: thioredoxin [Sneathiella sp.]|jgi:putative thioredoxin|uniref:thioredoxin n=1 Tax=Sneathiella sp. TaxID=1964365 RepID=UPI000C622669|nr:thioredoxin [Sneathiella sp.]MAL79021.1 thioredoxin [Sneathiella sp.]
METLISESAGTGDNLIKDGSTQTFMQDVVEASKERLVLVDLWAPWCGPCKQLGPIIEKVVKGAKGAASLVKIDIDQHPQIAQSLQVQSIPAVFAFKDGRPVDGFMGALPESKVKEFVERHAGPIGPSPVEQAFAAGSAALEAGETDVALTAFAKILELEPDNVEAKAQLARVYVKLGEIDAAKSLMETIADNQKFAPAVSAALAAISMAENAANAGELEPLRQRVEENPNDLDARLQYGRALVGHGNYEAGGEEFLDIIRRDRDWNEAAGRQELLKLLDLIGPANPLTKSLRRRLSSLLFS